MNKNIERKELLRINPIVDVDIDPTFLSLLQRAFIWANEIGLKGKAVTPFVLKKGSEEPFCHPKEAQHIIETSIFDPVRRDDVER